MDMVRAESISYEYERFNENGETIEKSLALNKVDIEIKPGEFVAVLGPNGSGKSTLAKQLNAIIAPSDGTLFIDGMDTKDEKNVWNVRKTAGMVFQNPDNQIIASVVEEDVGFGPENIGIPNAEIWQRVEESLKAVNMYAYRKHSPNKLSGGQKQRVAIASIMAMHPKCIILDEPTAMLDPTGRKEVIRACRALNDVEKITVILITHYMEEAVFADRIYCMQDGHIKMVGTPKELFSRVDELEEMKLDVPQVTKLSFELKKEGVDIPDGILTIDELVDALC